MDRFLRERGPVVGILGALDVEDQRLARPGFGSGQGGGGGPAQGSGSGTPPAELADVVRADAGAQFVDLSGTAIPFGDSGVVLPVEQQDLALTTTPGGDVIRDVDVDGVHYRMLTRHIVPGLAIQVARDMTGTDAILSGLRLRLLVLGLAGAAAAGLVGWLISRRSLRPVAALTEAASHVAQTRDLDARIQVERTDELGQLAHSFNSMLAALEETRLSQQRLVADASHELRTPLTSLRTNIELLEREAVQGPDRDELLKADVSAELLELTHLVSELVDLATIGRHEEPLFETDLLEVVTQAAARLERRSGVKVEVSGEPFPLEARATGLLRAVSNLLDDAAKWGGDAGPIEVRLTGAASPCATTARGYPKRTSCGCASGSTDHRRRARCLDRGSACRSSLRWRRTTAARSSPRTHPMVAR